LAEIERFCTQCFEDARRALLARDPLETRLVGFLDARIGALARLLEASPELADALEADPGAAAALRAHEVRMNILLRTALHDAGIHDEGAVEAFLGAAVEALRSGPITESAFRALLAAAVAPVLREVRPRRRRR
jgi:hypothetical protein